MRRLPARSAQRQRSTTRPVRAPAHKTGGEVTPGPIDTVQAWQQTIGNQATQAVLQRAMAAARPPPAIQAKITVGQAGDRYAGETEQVATQVMRIRSPSDRAGGTRVGRVYPKCEKGSHRQNIMPSAPRITAASTNRQMLMRWHRVYRRSRGMVVDPIHQTATGAPPGFFVFSDTQWGRYTRISPGIRPEEYVLAFRFDTYPYGADVRVRGPVFPIPASRQSASRVGNYLRVVAFLPVGSEWQIWVQSDPSESPRLGHLRKIVSEGERRRP